jgi:hypothetical protein
MESKSCSGFNYMPQAMNVSVINDQRLLGSFNKTCSWGRGLLWLASAFLLYPRFARGQDQEAGNIKLAKQEFAAFEAASRKEGGRTWGQRLYGPLLLVEPISRRIIANVPDSSGVLHAQNGVYVGQLPASMNTANTAMRWAGRRWSMLLWPLQIWPLPGDSYSRINLLAHESFHRIQPQLGFALPEANNAHLDEEFGRVYLLLEMAALRQAIGAATSAAAGPHVQAALAFRAYRRQLFPAAAVNENLLELNEGLAEYTGQVVSGRPRPLAVAYLERYAQSFTQDSSFVRSFAYQTVPLYGFLLHQQKPQWNRTVTAKTDLTALFTAAFGVTLPPDLPAWTQAALSRYGGPALLIRERVHEQRRQQRIAAFRHQFLEAPHLDIPLRKMNMAFNPTTAQPLGEAGTVYPNLRVSDEWGILTATAGALMGAKWEKVTVGYPTVEGSEIRGPGYTLALNPGWQLRKDVLSGNCTIQRVSTP